MGSGGILIAPIVSKEYLDEKTSFVLTVDKELNGALMNESENRISIITRLS